MSTGDYGYGYDLTTAMAMAWEFGSVLGRPWKLPGIILEAFLKDFLASEATHANNEKPKKISVFH